MTAPRLSDQRRDLRADFREFRWGNDALALCFPDTPVEAFHLIGKDDAWRVAGEDNLSLSHALG
jgi:hypothetical protein